MPSFSVYSSNFTVKLHRYANYRLSKIAQQINPDRGSCILLKESKGPHRVSYKQNTTKSIHPLSVTTLSLYGVTGVFTGVNPSYLWVRAGYFLDKSPAHRWALHWWQSPPCKVPTAHQEQFRVQYLAQGHFEMQLSSAQSWDWNQWPSDH